MHASPWAGKSSHAMGYAVHTLLYSVSWTAIVGIALASPLAAQSADPTVAIVNRSQLSILRVYVAKDGVKDWGGDWLGKDIVAPGGRFRVVPERDGTCVFDVRVEYSDSRREDRLAQDLCRLDELVFATTSAPSADFDVVNATTQRIRQLYVSPTESDSWGEDRLHGAMAPRGRFWVQLPRDGECHYDIRVVYADNSTEERRKQDLCATVDVAFDGTTRLTMSSPRSKSSGSGFFVSQQGHALTNSHVAGDCDRLVARLDGRPVPAHLVRRDAQNDLALIKVEVTQPVPFARFRASPSIRAGEGVLVAGYPLPDLLQNGLNVTVGNISALVGFGGNTARLQMTAAVQPGNSGGPLLDLGGHLVGVVVSRLQSLGEDEVAGAPQNINFAVQGAVARLFLEAEGQPIHEQQTTTSLPVGDVSDRARAFTFQVECMQ